MPLVEDEDYFLGSPSTIFITFPTPRATSSAIPLSVGMGVAVGEGGTSVAVGSAVGIGGTRVAVGGTGVAVGGTSVTAGGIGVGVGVGAAVGDAQPISASAIRASTEQTNCFFILTFP